MQGRSGVQMSRQARASTVARREEVFRLLARGATHKAIARHLRVSRTSVVGDVQGVGFRWFVMREAVRLGLVGWVANEPDGSVAVVAEGPPGALDGLADALGAGPPGARVETVTAHRLAPAGRFARFDIRPGGHPGD